jgi:penicillin-binding protein 2
MKLVASRLENREFKSSIRLIFLFVLLTFFILIFRLWQLQVMKGEYYDRESRENRIRTNRLVAPRGKILDRYGTVVVDNDAFLNLQITPRDAGKKMKQTVADLAALLQIPIEKFEEKISKARRQPSFMPIRLIRNLTYEQLAIIESNRMRLDGVSIEKEIVRAYPYGDFACHLLGYMGEVNREELDRFREEQEEDILSEGRGYKQGDLIGKMGIERELEEDLTGVNGIERYEAFASGRRKDVLGVLPPLPGNDVFLTLDFELDYYARGLMQGKSGAVIVLDVNTGEVLTLVSSPGFDLNLFTGGISSTNWKMLIENGMHPLENKTIRGQYPPASTYKIVTAVAGLETGIIDERTQFKCRGSIKVGNRNFRCWRAGGHGRVNLYRSLMESCDVYYYNVGLKVGIDTMAKYSRGFGFGVLTGLGGQHEKPGLVPTTTWKKNVVKDKWRPGDTVTASIGQGYNLVTPIQLVRAYAAIANGGKLLRPYVVTRIVDTEGKTLRRYKPKIVGNVPVSEKHLDLIREGLYAVVNGPRGTARRVKIKGVTVAGKTGTAQVASQASRTVDESDIPYKLRDHAWFVAYAPYEKPEVAIVVLVEHGGHGGAIAGPIARDVLARYFTLQEKRKSGQKIAGKY